MTIGQTNMSVVHEVCIGPLGNGTLAHGIYCESFGLQKIPTHARDDGFYGTPFRRSENTVQDKYTCSGQIVFRPRHDNLLYMLGHIMGQTGFTSEAMLLGTNGQAFKVGHKNKLKFNTFSNSKFDVATFSSSKTDSILKLTLQVEACEFITAATSGWPSGLTYSIARPFIHQTTELTIDGDTFTPEEISVAISRNLVKDEFTNSDKRVDLPEGDRTVQVTMTSPYNATTDDDLLALADASVAMSLTYSNGAYELKFECPALQSPIKTPTVNGKSPVRHQGITFEAGTKDGDAIAAPLKVTLTNLNP